MGHSPAWLAVAVAASMLAAAAQPTCLLERPTPDLPPRCADIAHQSALVQALADHWDTALPGRVMHVRYEDLVRDQVGADLLPLPVTLSSFRFFNGTQCYLHAMLHKLYLSGWTCGLVGAGGGSEGGCVPCDAVRPISMACKAYLPRSGLPSFAGLPARAQDRQDCRCPRALTHTPARPAPCLPRAAGGHHTCDAGALWHTLGAWCAGFPHHAAHRGHRQPGAGVVTWREWHATLSNTMCRCACTVPRSPRFVGLELPVKLCCAVCGTSSGCFTALQAVAPFAPPPSLPAPQVRQKLYRGSMLRFQRYARHLAPLLRPLRQHIARYEREAGLGSSEQLLADVLDGAPPAPAAVGDQQGLGEHEKKGEQQRDKQRGQQLAEEPGGGGRDEL